MIAYVDSNGNQLDVGDRVVRVHRRNRGRPSTDGQVTAYIRKLYSARLDPIPTGASQWTRMAVLEDVIGVWLANVACKNLRLSDRADLSRAQSAHIDPGSIWAAHIDRAGGRRSAQMDSDFLTDTGVVNSKQPRGLISPYNFDVPFVFTQLNTIDGDDFGIEQVFHASDEIVLNERINDLMEETGCDWLYMFNGNKRFVISRPSSYVIEEA